MPAPCSLLTIGVKKGAKNFKDTITEKKKNQPRKLYLSFLSLVGTNY